MLARRRARSGVPARHRPGDPPGGARVSASVVSNSCRLTIISSTLRVDLAVPVQISVAELLTIVVACLGRETADRGAAEGGWVAAARHGEAPLDPVDERRRPPAPRRRRALPAHPRARACPSRLSTTCSTRWPPGCASAPPAGNRATRLRAATAFAAAAVAVRARHAGRRHRSSDGARARRAESARCCSCSPPSPLGRVYRRRGPALTAAGFAVAYAAVVRGDGRGRRASATADFGAPQLLVAACAAAFASARRCS